MRKESKKGKAGMVFWGLLCVFLGVVLWLANEAILAFIVAGTVFGVAVFFTRQESDEGAKREVEEIWEGIVRRLLSGESEVPIRALVNGWNIAIPYREFIDPRKPLQGDARITPNTGFEGLFYCYFLLKTLSSYGLKKIEAMMDQEVEKWHRVWWQEWKKAWWSEVPSHLRKALVDRFEAREERESLWER